MVQARSKRAQRESDLVMATFEAIAAAMGWDRTYPRYELEGAAKARLITGMKPEARVELISRWDDELKAKLNPEGVE